MSSYPGQLLAKATYDECCSKTAKPTTSKLAIKDESISKDMNNEKWSLKNIEQARD